MENDEVNVPKGEPLFTIRLGESWRDEHLYICNQTSTADVSVYESERGRVINITDMSTPAKYQEAAESLALRSAAVLVACAFEEGYIQARSAVGTAALEGLRKAVREHRQEHADEGDEL